MGKVCHVRTCQMTCSAVGQIFWPIREWLTHVVFSPCDSPKFNKQIQMPNRSTNDVSWIHTLFQQPTTSSQVDIIFPYWLLKLGFLKDQCWGFQPLEQHPADYASVKTYPVFFDLFAVTQKNKHQDLGNSKKNPPSIFAYQISCFITLILDSYDS